MAVFQMNRITSLLGYLPPLVLKENHWSESGKGLFMGQVPVLSSNQHHRGTEGNSKPLTPASDNNQLTESFLRPPPDS